MTLVHYNYAGTVETSDGGSGEVADLQAATEEAIKLRAEEKA